MAQKRFRLLFTFLFILLITCAHSGAAHWSSKPFPGPVFIENKGQYPAETKELGKIGFGMQVGDPVLIGEKGVCVYVMNRDSRHLGDPHDREPDHDYSQGEESEKVTMEDAYRRINMTWEGANPNPRIRTERKRNDYFTCIMPARDGYTGLRMNGYESIVYEQLYEGIDLILETDQSRAGFKYSFRIRPGADPNQIHLKVTGDLSGMIRVADNQLFLSTDYGDVVQREVLAYTGDKDVVDCHFVSKGNSVRFALGAYDPTKELVIDPWVANSLASLSNNAIGYDVDYDYYGNLFVYGGGDLNVTGIDFKVSKYNSAGILQWTFLGAAASAGWTSNADITINVPGNFIVDKSSGKTYVAQSFEANGARMIRLDANGNYDNFVSLADPNYLETWDMVFDCTTGEVFASGGGTSSDINFGVVNSSTGVVSSANITGMLGLCCQDIVNATNDFSGNIYVVFAETPTPMPGIGNHIYKVNAARNGNLWSQPTGYNTLNEANNKPFFLNVSTNYSGNGANVLAVNDNYLFYYDGVRLKAFNKTSGTPVGTPFFVGGSPLEQTGIAVDNCNNVYVGGTGVIRPYAFNGTTFTPLATIPLGPGLSTNSVHDIRYSFAENALYVTGTGFAGVYSATQSASCNSITIIANGSCSGSASAVVTTNIPGINFDYLWFNSSGALIRNQTTSNLTDSTSGLAPGTYTVRVEVAGGCGGPAAVDTFTIGTGGFAFSIAAVQPTCINPNGGTASVVNLSGGLAPFTYSWNTNPVQTTATATGLSGGNYTCLVTDASGCSSSQFVTLNAVVPIVATGTQINVTCYGGSDGAASAIPPSTGGPFTFFWQPGGATTSTITGLSAGSYSCIVTDTNGCTSPVGFTISQPSQPQLSISANPSSVCPGEQSTLTVTGSGSFLWSNGATASTTVVSLVTQSVYTVAVTDSIGCISTGSVTINVHPVPNAAFTVNDVCEGEPVQFVNSSTIAGGGPLTFSWDFGDGGSSSQVSPSHIYSASGNPLVWLVVKSANNCIDSTSSSLTVWPSPLAGLSGNPLKGCPVLQVSFTSTSTSNDSITAYNWMFSNGVNSALPQVNVPFTSSGFYDAYLQVTTIHGCKDDTLLGNYVEVYDEPIAGFDVTPPVTTELFPEIRFLDLSSGANAWSWDFGDTSAVSFVREPVHIYSAPGSYTVYQMIENANGCRDTAIRVVRIGRDNSIYVPNAFTPNGDGRNDEFMVYGFNITDFNLSIFNRWGMKIFSSDEMGQAWDGTYDGVESPQGVYVYLVTYRDVQDKVKTLSGKVHLIR